MKPAELSVRVEAHRVEIARLQGRIVAEQETIQKLQETCRHKHDDQTSALKWVAPDTYDCTICGKTHDYSA